MTGSDPLWQAAVAHVRALALGDAVPTGARVVLHFHPDAPAGGTRGRTVIEALADGKVYRSQFETGTSNGGLTAFRAGDRWRWESRLFGAVYDDAAPAVRPRYGSLLLDGDPYGASPRFGSSYLRLRPELLERTTFCYPDSVFDPRHVGTADRFALAALAARAPMDDPLDRYVEAHVHGAVRVPDDVEALVLDPSYRGTAVEDAAGLLGCAVEWQPGYAAHIDDLRQHADYRGPEAVELAGKIQDDGALTPAALGPWRDRGDVDPQTLKRVWHLVARFGRRA